MFESVRLYTCIYYIYIYYIIIYNHEDNPHCWWCKSYYTILNPLLMVPDSQGHSEIWSIGGMPWPLGWRTCSAKRSSKKRLFSSHLRLGNGQFWYRWCRWEPWVIHMYIYIYTHVKVCVCVRVCVSVRGQNLWILGCQSGAWLAFNLAQLGGHSCKKV